MKKGWLLAISVFVITSCVELYEFDVNANTSTLVVEGYISDKSFIDTRTYPSDGRFFQLN